MDDEDDIIIIDDDIEEDVDTDSEDEYDESSDLSEYDDAIYDDDVILSLIDSNPDDEDDENSDSSADFETRRRAGDFPREPKNFLRDGNIFSGDIRFSTEFRFSSLRRDAVFQAVRTAYGGYAAGDFPAVRAAADNSFRGTFAGGNIFEQRGGDFAGGAEAVGGRLAVRRSNAAHDAGEFAGDVPAGLRAAVHAFQRAATKNNLRAGGFDGRSGGGVQWDARRVAGDSDSDAGSGVAVHEKQTAVAERDTGGSDFNRRDIRSDAAFVEQTGDADEFANAVELGAAVDVAERAENV